jgi:hypothetical protein
MPWPVAWSLYSQWEARVASSMPTAPWIDPGDCRIASILRAEASPRPPSPLANLIGRRKIGPLASRGAGLKLNEGLGARRRIRLGLDGHASRRCPVHSFEANVCLQR